MLQFSMNDHGGSNLTRDPASAACLHPTILAQKSYRSSTSYLRHNISLALSNTNVIFGRMLVARVKDIQNVESCVFFCILNFAT